MTQKNGAKKCPLVTVDGYPVKQDETRYLMSLGGVTVRWIDKNLVLGFLTRKNSRCRGFYTTLAEAQKRNWLYEHT